MEAQCPTQGLASTGSSACADDDGRVGGAAGAHAMRRREFIVGLGAAAMPFAARAQERLRRVGVMMSVSADDTVGQVHNAAFLQGLQQLGWTVGRNVRIDYRWAGTGDAARKHAAELVALAPEVILAAGSQATAPLLQTTRTVPIVFVHTPDPVGAGTAWHNPAATPRALRNLNTASPGNGWSCSSRLRRTQRALRSFAIRP